jgi:hypothetical protein
VHRKGKFGHRVTAIAAGVLALGISVAQATSVSANTSYSGALIERLTPSGFVAMNTSQPDVAAATAAQPQAFNGDIAGWGGTSVSTDSPTDAWAAGYFTDRTNTLHPVIEHFYNNTWHYYAQPRLPLPSRLYGIVAITSSDVWAVGTHTIHISGTTAERTFTEHWNGSAWSVIPAANVVTGTSSNWFNAVAAAAPNDVWAGGVHCDASNSSCGTLLEHWNGQQWSVVPTSESSAGCCGIRSLTADSPTDAWAVGSDSSGAFVLHWNGTSWTDVPSAVPAPTSVYAIDAVSSTDVWAVGINLLEHWDGTAWHLVQGPNPNCGAQCPGWLAVSAASSTDVYAVGYVDNSPDCYTCTVAAHWDGSSWHAVPSQNPTVSGYCPDCGEYIVDSFSSVSAVPGAAFALGVQGRGND